MENIAAFLRAVEAIGVPHHELFETVDLYELKDPVQVLITIRSLSRHAHQKNPNIPVIGPKLAQPNQKRAPFKKEPNVASWNVHQYGYMHGASQGSEGVVFGGTHNVIAPLEMQKSKMTKGVDQSDEDTKFESPPISNTATPQLGGGRIGFALGKAARGLNTESDISKLSISQNNFRLDQSGTHKTSEKDLLKEVIKTDYVGENDPQEKSTTQSLDSIQQNPKIEEKAIAVQDHTMPKVLETADVTFEQKEQQPTVEDEFDFNSQNIDSSTTGRSRYADLQLPIKSPPFESRHTLRKPTAEKNSISSSSKVNITQSPSQPVRTISLDLDSPKSYTQQPSGFELPKKSPVLATLSKSPTESPKPPPKPIGLSIRPANHPKGPREFIDSSKRKTTRSVFGNDFDSDNDDGYNGKNSSFQIQRNQVNAQLAVGHSNSQSSVMIEDPSIYHYDEVYDSMKAAENQLQAASSDDKTVGFDKIFTRVLTILTSQNI